VSEGKSTEKKVLDLIVNKAKRYQKMKDRREDILESYFDETRQRSKFRILYVFGVFWIVVFVLFFVGISCELIPMKIFEISMFIWMLVMFLVFGLWFRARRKLSDFRQSFRKSYNKREPSLEKDFEFLREVYTVSRRALMGE